MVWQLAVNQPWRKPNWGFDSLPESHFMTERETILEEVRAAFAAVQLEGTVGEGKKKTYVPRVSAQDGCETCGYGSTEYFDMDTVNAVVDYLKTNTLTKTV